MNIMIGDTIVTDDGQIGIVENRTENSLTVRFPDYGNRRDPVLRKRAKPLAKLIYEAKADGKRLSLGTSIKLAGNSTLAELVSLFGYSTGQMRRDSLQKVLNQLMRAGLEITSETDRWSRDDKFKLSLPPVPLPLEPDEDDGDERSRTGPSNWTMTTVALPDLFWPSALGLDRRRELEFLRALSESDPILCILHVPTESQAQGWLQSTWEGLTAWAYRSAQRFCLSDTYSPAEIRIRVGPAALLHTSLKPSALDNDAPRLADLAHNLNLITIRNELELPTDFARLNAVWPGPVFEFKPDYKGEPLADIRSINCCLFAATGGTSNDTENRSPLLVLNWARTAYAQLLAGAVTEWGGVITSNNVPHFKGSNETSTALALKAHLANWVKRSDGDAVLEFEYSEDEDDETVDESSDESDPLKGRRVDLHVKGVGCFEVESMRGSGPMESFYHRKIFARLKKGMRFFLIVPGEAILWAGPYLSDLAHHLGENNGRVMVPSTDGAFLEIGGKQLVAHRIERSSPLERVDTASAETAVFEGPIRLEDVAGYEEVKRRIDELIIWPEKHGKVLRPASRSSGILFFGPPGCGKSRWARAIAGELEQEVRLLAPSDLRGPYLGWGQIMIREQFDWLAENDNRMLVIDELDAIARSRQEFQMHSDDKASVNELLVQLDRVLSLGRLMVATTNFIGSMDDAVMRSGRFGRFIPVPPPDLQESIAILDYYLRRLELGYKRRGTFNIRVPDKESLEAIIEPLYKENRERVRFYCGADLEEAVNRAYSRGAQRAWPDGGWSQESAELEVHLTGDDLKWSLIEVPRSIQEDAVDQFLEDLNRFCGGQIAESISSRLRPTFTTCAGFDLRSAVREEKRSRRGSRRRRASSP
jgi:DNA polymerase III delta prime subunit